MPCTWAQLRGKPPALFSGTWSCHQGWPRHLGTVGSLLRRKWHPRAIVTLFKLDFEPLVQPKLNLVGASSENRSKGLFIHCQPLQFNQFAIFTQFAPS
jgi:hypothetical protein